MAFPGTFKQLAWRLSPAIAALALFSSTGYAAPADAPGRAPGAARMEHRQQWIHERLERAANRLEIKASQQDAWQAFAQSVEAFATPPAATPPGRDADAAAIARFRADRAAEAARKLSVVADATSRLQGVLTPDQRKVFDEMAHRFAGPRHRHHDGRERSHGDRSERHQG